MKTWLVTKKAPLARATTAFANTWVKVTCEDRPYLGIAIGSKECIRSYIKRIHDGQPSCLKNLASIALHNPMPLL